MILPGETEAGAETLPHAAPVQPAPDSAQLTPLFWLSFVTIALKVVVPLTGIVAVVWERATAIVEAGAAVIVIVAVADFVPSAIEVALSVTFAGLGTTAGAGGGVGTLVGLYVSARRLGGDIKLASLSSHANEVLQVTKIGTIIEIFDKAEDAVASFKRAATHPDRRRCP